MARPDADRRRAFVLAAMLPSLAAASGWPEVALPDGTKAAEVASHMIYNGTDMHSQIFTSALKADDVVKYYRDLWDGQSVLSTVDGWQIVGHREGDFFVTVQIRTEGGGSRGDIGVTRIPKEKVTVELGKGVPHPANTLVFNDIAYPDDATPARTVAMSNGLSVQQNASFYRGQLAASGWKPAQVSPCATSAPACVMSYEQGDRKLTLMLSRNGARSDIVINMMGEGVIQ